MNVTPVLISSAEPSTTLVNTPGRVHAVPVAPDLRREMRLCIDNVSTVGAAFRPSSRRKAASSAWVAPPLPNSVGMSAEQTPRSHNRAKGSPLPPAPQPPHKNKWSRCEPRAPGPLLEHDRTNPRRHRPSLMPRSGPEPTIAPWSGATGA